MLSAITAVIASQTIIAKNAAHSNKSQKRSDWHEERHGIEPRNDKRENDRPLFNVCTPERVAEDTERQQRAKSVFKYEL